MKQRIVEETLANGKKKYRVEVKTWLFGWKTASFYDIERDMNFDAIFRTLEEAKTFMEISSPVVSRKVIDV